MDQITITLEQFRAVMLAAGYDEVMERKWSANTVVSQHPHPFEANALVVDGEMWLTIEDGAPRRLVAGDTFHLDAGVPHAERYSESGAVYWVGRRARSLRNSVGHW